MPKVAHLTSVHPPFDTRIFYKECKTLVRAGYEVVLIAPHDSDEVVGGVCIRAVPNPNGRRERMTRTVYTVYRTVLSVSADIYHFHDPELILFGLLLKLRGKRVIYDVHEDVPRQVLSKNWIPRWLRFPVSKLIEIVELIGARAFDGIVAATPSIAGRFPSNKTITVQNFPIRGEFVPVNPSPYSQRPPLVTYIGGITAIRGITEMVQAMTLLPASLGVRLVLAGKFESVALEGKVRQLPGWDRVDFVGWQSRSQIALLLGQARVGLNILHPIPNYYYQPYSVKMFEYMAAGLPMIVSDFPSWREFLEDVGCALFVDPLDSKAIALAIQWLLNHPYEAEKMGRQGMEFVAKMCNWEVEATKLIDLYNKLIAPKKKPYGSESI